MGTTEIKENKDIEVVENDEVVEEAEVVEDAEATEDVQEIKPYTLRNPKATDIASFLKLFSKLGVKDFKDSFSGNGFKELIAKEREKLAGDEDDEDTSKFLENVGIGLAFDLVDVILTKLSDCQREVFVCLSHLSGMTVDEVADLDHYYSVRCVVGDGDKIVINSAELTITLVKADGTQENMFRYRDKQSDVFEKISPGNHRVMWNGSFDFDLSVIHERGEPKWT